MSFQKCYVDFNILCFLFLFTFLTSPRINSVVGKSVQSVEMDSGKLQTLRLNQMDDLRVNHGELKRKLMQIVDSKLTPYETLKDFQRKPSIDFVLVIFPDSKGQFVQKTLTRILEDKFSRFQTNDRIQAKKALEFTMKVTMDKKDNYDIQTIKVLFKLAKETLECLEEEASGTEIDSDLWCTKRLKRQLKKRSLKMANSKHSSGKHETTPIINMKNAKWIELLDHLIEDVPKGRGGQETSTRLTMSLIPPDNLKREGFLMILKHIHEEVISKFQQIQSMKYLIHATMLGKLLRYLDVDILLTPLDEKEQETQLDILTMCKKTLVPRLRQKHTDFTFECDAVLNVVEMDKYNESNNMYRLFLRVQGEYKNTKFISNKISDVITEMGSDILKNINFESFYMDPDFVDPKKNYLILSFGNSNQEDEMTPSQSPLTESPPITSTAESYYNLGEEEGSGSWTTVVTSDATTIFPPITDIISQNPQSISEDSQMATISSPEQSQSTEVLLPATTSEYISSLQEELDNETYQTLGDTSEGPTTVSLVNEEVQGLDSISQNSLSTSTTEEDSNNGKQVDSENSLRSVGTSVRMILPPINAPAQKIDSMSENPPLIGEVAEAPQMTTISPTVTPEQSTPTEFSMITTEDSSNLKDELSNGRSAPVQQIDSILQNQPLIDKVPQMETIAPVIRLEHSPPTEDYFNHENKLPYGRSALSAKLSESSSMLPLITVPVQKIEPFSPITPSTGEVSQTTIISLMPTEYSTAEVNSGYLNRRMKKTYSHHVGGKNITREDMDSFLFLQHLVTQKVIPQLFAEYPTSELTLRIDQEAPDVCETDKLWHILLKFDFEEDDEPHIPIIEEILDHIFLVNTNLTRVEYFFDFSQEMDKREAIEILLCFKDTAKTEGHKPLKAMKRYSIDAFISGLETHPLSSTENIEPSFRKDFDTDTTLSPITILQASTEASSYTTDVPETEITTHSPASTDSFLTTTTEADLRKNPDTADSSPTSNIEVQPTEETEEISITTTAEPSFRKDSDADIHISSITTTADPSSRTDSEADDNVSTSPSMTESKPLTETVETSITTTAEPSFRKDSDADIHISSITTTADPGFRIGSEADDNVSTSPSMTESQPLTEIVETSITTTAEPSFRKESDADNHISSITTTADPSFRIDSETDNIISTFPSITELQPMTETGSYTTNTPDDVTTHPLPSTEASTTAEPIFSEDHTISIETQHMYEDNWLKEILNTEVLPQLDGFNPQRNLEFNISLKEDQHSGDCNIDIFEVKITDVAQQLCLSTMRMRILLLDLVEKYSNITEACGPLEDGCIDTNTLTMYVKFGKPTESCSKNMVRMNWCHLEADGSPAVPPGGSPDVSDGTLPLVVGGSPPLDLKKIPYRTGLKFLPK